MSDLVNQAFEHSDSQSFDDLRKLMAADLIADGADTDEAVFLSDKVTYLFDTLEVSHSEGELVFVSLDVRIERDGKTQERTINVGLIEEDDGWRIDNPTYANYNEYKDRYDELNNKDLK